MGGKNTSKLLRVVALIALFGAAGAVAGKRDSGLPTFPLNESYTSVRQKLLSAGWQPFHAADADVCSKSDTRCQGRPEMQACAGTGMANCRFLWRKDGQTVAVMTVGEDAAFASVESLNSSAAMASVAEAPTLTWPAAIMCYGPDKRSSDMWVFLADGTYYEEINLPANGKAPADSSGRYGKFAQTGNRISLTITAFAESLTGQWRLLQQAVVATHQIDYLRADNNAATTADRAFRFQQVERTVNGARQEAAPPSDMVCQLKTGPQVETAAQKVKADMNRTLAAISGKTTNVPPQGQQQQTTKAAAADVYAVLSDADRQISRMESVGGPQSPCPVIASGYRNQLNNIARYTQQAASTNLNDQFGAYLQQANSLIRQIQTAPPACRR